MSDENMVKKDRRCWGFEDDGTRAGRGCTRPAKVCWYLHPEEPDWDNFPPLGPPKRGSRRASDGYRSDRGRNKDRKTSFDVTHAGPSGWRSRRRSRSRSKSRSRSRSRSPARGRGRSDSIASSNISSSRAGVVPKTKGGSFELPRRVSIDDVSNTAAGSSPHSQTQPPHQRAPTPTEPSSSKKTFVLPTPPTTATLNSPTSPLGRRQPTIFVQPSSSSLTRPPSFVSPLTKHPTTLMASPLATPTTPAFDFRSPSISFPPPPKDPAPIHPPQPLPQIPATLTLDTSEPTQEPDHEQKAALWKERIKYLADHEEARERYEEQDEEYNLASKVLQGAYFQHLPLEEQSRLQGELDVIAAERDKAKGDMEAAMSGLVQVGGSWPAAPPQEVPEGTEEAYRDVIKYVKELKDTAEGMSKMLSELALKDVAKELPKEPLFLKGDANDEEEEGIGRGQAMDVDKPQSGGVDQPSRKRRRVSENEYEPTPSQEELEQLLGRLAKLEGTTSDLNNSLDQLEHNETEEFNAALDEKLKEASATHTSKVRELLQNHKAAQGRSREKERQRVGELKVEIDKMGEDVGEVATEIGLLYQQIDGLEQQVVDSKKLRDESMQRMSEVEQRLKEYTATQETNRQAIDTLRTALDAYKACPPSPPQTPYLALPKPSGVPSTTSTRNTATSAYVLAALKEPLVEALRPHLRPILEELREQTEKMVRDGSGELYSNVWGKVQMTLKVLEMIKGRVEQAHAMGGQPVPVQQAQFGQPVLVQPGEQVQQGQAVQGQSTHPPHLMHQGLPMWPPPTGSASGGVANPGNVSR